MKPIIVINYKTYDEGTGERGLHLAKTCEELSQEKEIDIIIAPQVGDIFRIANLAKVSIVTQSVDAVEDGKHTGAISPRNVKQLGALGTLVNHSECRKDMDEIKKIFEICRALDLVVICCADTPEKAQEIARLSPDVIAIEPPELIGTGVSVSTANPDIVTRTVQAVHDIDPNIPVLCGAGITNNIDIKRALELGTVGVLLSSAVLLSKNTRETLYKLLEGF
ncbi:triose-phosphate isomerase [Candidatus Micrarchaeota archaeon RBG_16_49_10]|nr:MAG: triose-phosphate isomerase [Candidatus Micrarchaeota archaeon RBG_16_49_10]